MPNFLGHYKPTYVCVTKSHAGLSLDKIKPLKVGELFLLSNLFFSHSTLKMIPRAMTLGWFLKYVKMLL